SRQAMKEILKEIQNGKFAKDFILEGMTGYPRMTAERRNCENHPIEQVGKRLRSMMPWIQKIVDKEKN
ncbi:MAG: ketol-acid reductoisomerase, partial [Epsilonproteobacteria bacterium]|nr:ketol-acid reductoisomerase [Campylobacterota bacterium]